MDEDKIERIISNTVFSMEVEGFIVTQEEKDVLKDVLSGKIQFKEQLQKYIEEAKRMGEIANV
jgi:hypothetical protein